MHFIVTFFKGDDLVQCQQVDNLIHAKDLASNLQFKDVTRAEIREIGRRIAEYNKPPPAQARPQAR